MGELAEQVAFGAETSQAFGAGTSRRQELDRHVTTWMQLLGEVHLAHASGRQRALESIVLEAPIASLEIDRAQQVMLEQMEERLQAIKGRRRDLEREVVVLESEVGVEEEDMEILEAVLDDRLGLR